MMELTTRWGMSAKEETVALADRREPGECQEEAHDAPTCYLRDAYAKPTVADFNAVHRVHFAQYRPYI